MHHSIKNLRKPGVRPNLPEGQASRRFARGARSTRRGFISGKKPSLRMEKRARPDAVVPVLAENPDAW
jgi:hypothetical protein